MVVEKAILTPPEGFRRLLILGVGEQVCDIAIFCARRGIRLQLFAGPRQAEAVLAVRTHLPDLDATIVDSIRSAPTGPYATADRQTLVMSLGSPWIIRRDLIDLYEGRIINTHGAPLPEWRGGGGFSWRIMAGDRRGASCFHLVTEGLDDGPIIQLRPYEFPAHCRKPCDYIRHALEVEREAVVDLLDAIHEGRELAIARQEEAAATYFPRLSTDLQGYIDWCWPGSDIERFILAFSNPYDGASTFIGEQRVHLLDAKFSPTDTRWHPFMHGLIIYMGESVFHVAVDGGRLVVPADAISGALPRLGDRFHTPPPMLERARAYRPVYTPAGLLE